MLGLLRVERLFENLNLLCCILESIQEWGLNFIAVGQVPEVENIPCHLWQFPKVFTPPILVTLI
jgi:hypothetical protein